jgi:hypothetical protein
LGSLLVRFKLINPTAVLPLLNFSGKLLILAVCSFVFLGSFQLIFILICSGLIVGLISLRNSQNQFLSVDSNGAVSLSTRLTVSECFTPIWADSKGSKQSVSDKDSADEMITTTVEVRWVVESPVSDLIYLYRSLISSAKRAGLDPSNTDNKSDVIDIKSLDPTTRVWRESALACLSDIFAAVKDLRFDELSTGVYLPVYSHSAYNSILSTLPLVLGAACVSVPCALSVLLLSLQFC